MTSPPSSGMTVRTPLFQLPHLAQGQPMYETRDVLEALAKRLDAVLATKAVTPPGASDLAALATRVGVLETDQTAEDALAARVVVTFAAGWEQFPTSSAPYGEALRVWKETPQVVRVQGMARARAAVAAGSNTVDMFTLPSGFRPALQVVRHVGVGGSASVAAYLVRLEISAAGVVTLMSPQGWTLNQFCTLDFSFRTVNP